MPRELIAAALREAETRPPAIQAAIWMHAARVVATFDQPAARDLLDRALVVIREVEDEDRPWLMTMATMLAGAVSPDRATELLAEASPDEANTRMDLLFAAMHQHGHFAEVAALLSVPQAGHRFPIHAAMEAMGRAPDDGVRRAILRNAIKAFHDGPVGASSRPFGPGGAGAFLRFLSDHWRLLPESEARDVVRQVVSRVLSTPDQRVRAGHGFLGEDIRFSSSHAHQLFQVLGPLRHLDPALTESLIKQHAELARAAARLPFGDESMRAVLEQKIAAAGPPPDPPPMEPFEFVNGRMVLASELVATGHQDAFVAARHAYDADVADGGNTVPKECWPSTMEYRHLLYRAARYEGRAAVKYLDQVPDVDLRLMASIELAAALSGLPILGGTTSSRRQVDRDRSPRASGHLPSEAVPPNFLRWQPLPPARKPNLPASNTVRIALSTRGANERASGGAGPDFWTMENMPLHPAIARLWDVPEARVELRAGMDDRRFDIHLLLESDVTRETMERLMREGLERHFDMAMVREQRLEDVYVLTAPDGIRAVEAEEWPDRGMRMSSLSYTSDGADALGAGPFGNAFDMHAILDLHALTSEKPRPRSWRDMARDPSLSIRARPGARLAGVSGPTSMSELCDALEGTVGRPVIDETGLTKKYVLKVERRQDGSDDLLEVLRSAHGLVALTAQREVSRLVWRPRSG